MSFRVGYGHDLHRLQAGGQLVLGGVVVADGISPVAHSDGDVVLHALVDALLGAVGGGDIGDAFPNSDPRWKGAASRVFLDHAAGIVRDKGWSVGNIDLLVLAERPKLGKFKPQIARHIESLLSLPEGSVNVKAGTNEGCDAVGRGEAIAATVVVLLTRNREGAK